MGQRAIAISSRPCGGISHWACPLKSGAGALYQSLVAMSAFQHYRPCVDASPLAIAHFAGWGQSAATYVRDSASGQL
jgi:hypothetical protein